MIPDRHDALSPIPTPKNLYVHDDITNAVRSDPESRGLVGQLFDLLRRDGRVRVLTEQEQIEGLLAQGSHDPFATTVAIGDAGAEVAERLHKRTGWFPEITTIDLHREEDGVGEYVLVTASGLSLDGQLSFVGGARSVAVVDNTLFSGLTMRGVLEAFPEGARNSTHAFCLRGVAETVSSVEALCPIALGFAAQGRIDEDVSLINASGLVTRVGIKRVGKPPLAFFERPQWMRAWFPGYADEVVDLCRRLNALLEGR